MEEDDEGAGPELNMPENEHLTTDSVVEKKDEEIQQVGFDETKLGLVALNPLYTSTPVCNERVSRLEQFCPALSPVVEPRTSSFAAGDAEEEKRELVTVLAERQKVVLALKEKLRVEHDMVTTLNKRITELEIEVNTLKRGSEEKDQHNMVLTTKLNSQMAYQAEEINKLRKNLEDSNKTISQLQELIKEKNVTLVELRLQKESLVHELQPLKENDEKLKKKIKFLQNQRDDALEKCIQLQEKETIVEKFAKLEVEHEALQEKCRKQELQWKEQLEALQAEKISWQEILNKEKSDHQARSKNFESEIEELRNSKMNLLAEKKTFLQSATKFAKEQVEWREKIKALENTLQKQQEELVRYMNLESQHNDLQNEFKIELSKKSELTAKLEEQRTEAKKFRDEIEHLRSKVAKGRPNSRSEGPVHAVAEESERLQYEFSVCKQKLEQLSEEMEKKNNEIARLREETEEKRKQVALSEEDKTALKIQCGELELECMRLNEAKRQLFDEYENYKKEAEEQYFYEMQEKNKDIQIRDENIEHLRSQIAALIEQSDTPLSSVSQFSTSLANLTVWDVIPNEVRRLFDSLRKRYEELNEVVNGMKATHFTVGFDKSLCSPKILEDKATDCCEFSNGITSITLQDPSYCSSASDALRNLSLEDSFLGAEGREIKNQSLNSLKNHLVSFHLKGECRIILDIQQHLVSLLDAVQECNGSDVSLAKAVESFYAGVDSTLKGALVSTENFRHSYEQELVKREKERERSEQEKEECKRLLQKNTQELTTLQATQKQLEQKNCLLDSERKHLEEMLREVQNILDEKTKYGNEAAKFIEHYDGELEKANDKIKELNEILTENVHEVKELRKQKNDRDADIAKAEFLLAKSTKECAELRNNLQEEGEKCNALQKEIDCLRKKCTKREEILREFDDIVNLLIKKNNGLKQTNTWRQQKIELFYKFLCRHGIEVEKVVWPLGQTGEARPNESTDERQMELYEIATELEKENLRASPTEINRFAKRFMKNDSVIAEEERRCYADEIVLPKWRKLRSCSSSSADG